MGMPDEWEQAIFLAHPDGRLRWVVSEDVAAFYERNGFKRTTRAYYENRLDQEKVKNALRLYADYDDDRLLPKCPLNGLASGLRTLEGWLYYIRLMVVRKN